jgi:hypothetical protein
MNDGRLHPGQRRDQMVLQRRTHLRATLSAHNSEHLGLWEPIGSGRAAPQAQTYPFRQATPRQQLGEGAVVRLASGP